MRNLRLKSMLFCLLITIAEVFSSLSIATQPLLAQELSSPESAPIALGAGIDEKESESSGNALLFSIPVGEEGILYEGVEEQAGVTENPDDEVDTLSWGPTALALGTDGTFWVADDVGQRIRQYDATGTLLTTIDTADRLVNLSALAVAKESLFALDMADEALALWQLDRQGNTVITATLPITNENGFTGLTVDSAGTLWLEQLGGAYRTQFVNTVGTWIATAEEQVVDWSSPDPHWATLIIGDRKIEVHTARPLANLRLLQVTASGDIFLVVEEIALTPEVLVDQTVRHYAPDGTLLGMARVPLADQVVEVASNLAVAPNNEIYALVPRREQVEVQRLVFSLELAPILPDEDAELDNQVFLPFITSNQVEQDEVSAVAMDGLEIRGGCSSSWRPWGNCTFYFSRASSKRLYQQWKQLDLAKAAALALCSRIPNLVASAACIISFVARGVNVQLALANAHRQKACLAVQYNKISGLWWFSSHNGQHCFPMPSKTLRPSCLYPWPHLLKIGSQGPAVAQLQRRLNKTGSRLAVDESFGPKTYAAVIAFQRARGLVDDGIVGPKTQAALNKICP